MTKTKRKKIRNHKIIEFRKQNKIDKCCRCGAELKNTLHHFLCKSCWDIQQNFPVFDRPKAIKHKENRKASSCIFKPKCDMICEGAIPH